MNVTHDQMPALVADFLQNIAPKQSAYVIALSGNLGAGKTTFSQILAQQLGITEHVTSPTFVIMKQYVLTNQLFTQLVHIDAYRLESAEELQKLHIETILQDANNLVLIEWPENVANLLPKDATRVTLKVVDDTTRDITITYA